MMKVIHKFVPELSNDYIRLPAGNVLSIAEQDGTVAVWLERRVKNMSNDHVQTLRLYGTGLHFHNDVPTAFVGTVMLHKGNLVLHAYIEAAN